MLWQETGWRKAETRLEKKKKAHTPWDFSRGGCPRAYVVVCSLFGPVLAYTSPEGSQLQIKICTKKQKMATEESRWASENKTLCVWSEPPILLEGRSTDSPVQVSEKGNCQLQLFQNCGLAVLNLGGIKIYEINPPNSALYTRVQFFHETIIMVFACRNLTIKHAQNISMGLFLQCRQV